MLSTSIIFGANGQDGHYLALECSRRGHRVVSVSRTTGVVGDVSDRTFVEELVKQHKPTHIFHLAANSTTRQNVILENINTIGVGTYNILESVRRYSAETRVFIAGSGLQFKNNGQPISEHDEFVSNSAYSLVRNCSVECARYYRLLGLRVYVGYLFHHESPMRKPTHVSKIVTSAAKSIANGGTEKIEIGDITVEKEWTFAGDIVRGILCLVDQDIVFESTIGSGEGHTIQDWLEVCFSLVGINWRNHVVVREGFKSEYQRLISDTRTIQSLGWRNEMSFDSLARMMMQ